MTGVGRVSSLRVTDGITEELVRPMSEGGVPPNLYSGRRRTKGKEYICVPNEGMEEILKHNYSSIIKGYRRYCLMVFEPQYFVIFKVRECQDLPSYFTKWPGFSSITLPVWGRSPRCPLDKERRGSKTTFDLNTGVVRLEMEIPV